MVIHAVHMQYYDICVLLKYHGRKQVKNNYNTDNEISLNVA